MEQDLQHLLDRAYRRHGPWRTLWYLYESQRRRLLAAAAIYVVKHAPLLVLPIATGLAIDSVAQPDESTPTRLLAIGVGMVLLIATNVPTHTWYAMIVSRAIRDVQLRLRAALTLRLQQLSIRFHENFESGRIQAKLLRDVESVEVLTRQLITNGLGTLTGVVVVLVVAVGREPLVALLFLIGVPLAVGLIHGFRRQMGRRNRQFRSELEGMAAMVNEMLVMIPLSRAHALEDRELRRMQRKLVRIRHFGRRVDFVNELFGSSSWASMQIFQFAAVMFTVWLCFRGRLSVGEVTMFSGYFAHLVATISHAISITPIFATGREAIRSIGEVLECPDIEHNEGKQSVEYVRGDIRFENVCFSYSENTCHALSNINLHVRPGERIALVGPSGSGKSTMLNLIIGFRRPQSGRLLMDGKDMAELNLREFRRFVSVVPQNSVLFSGTILENITYGLETVDPEALQRVLERANVLEFVEKLPAGLHTRVGESGGKLSGGQRQRISIARAMLRDPRLILLDEATSALDVESERHVQAAIEELSRDRTTFIVAHRLSTVRHVDRVVVLSEGRVAEVGPPAELLERGGDFARLWGLQNG